MNYVTCVLLPVKLRMEMCDRPTICGISVEVRSISFRPFVVQVLMLNALSLSGILMENSHMGCSLGTKFMYRNLRNFHGLY